MGVAALPRITAELLDAGADPSMPAAVIENGWTPAQRVITGTVATIAEASHAAEVAPPAVIVIGDVAALAEG